MTDKKTLLELAERVERGETGWEIDGAIQGTEQEDVEVFYITFSEYGYIPNWNDVCSMFTPGLFGKDSKVVVKRGLDDNCHAFVQSHMKEEKIIQIINKIQAVDRLGIVPIVATCGLLNSMFTGLTDARHVEMGGSDNMAEGET